MNYEIKYSNLKDRQARVAIEEAKGLVMLQDNFDPDWKRGDEPHGTMIFTDDPGPAPAVIPPPRDLGKELDDLKAILKAKGVL